MKVLGRPSSKFARGAIQYWRIAAVLILLALAYYYFLSYPIVRKLCSTTLTPFTAKLLIQTETLETSNELQASLALHHKRLCVSKATRFDYLARRNNSKTCPEPRIFLTSLFTTNDESLALIPHFIEHYLFFGLKPENFLIALHNSSSGNIDKAIEILSRYNITPKQITSQYTSQENANRHKSMLKYAGFNAADWAVPADMDEFHYFHRPIPEIVKECIENGYSHVSGYFVDRISPTGKLQNISPSPSIFEQFPNECQLWRISQSFYRKILLHNGLRRAQRGHHAISSTGVITDASKDIPKECWGQFDVLRHPLIFPTYHFKWNAGVSKLLSSRIATYLKNNISWVSESLQLEKFLKDHDGVCLYCEEVPCRSGFMPDRNNPFTPLLQRHNPLYLSKDSPVTETCIKATTNTKFIYEPRDKQTVPIDMRTFTFQTAS